MNRNLDWKVPGADVSMCGAVTYKGAYPYHRIFASKLLAFVFFGVVVSICIQAQFCGATNSETPPGLANRPVQPNQGWYVPAGGLLKPDLNISDVSMLKKLAESGEPQSLFLIGSMYFEGTGLPPNPKIAIEMWRRAAEQDHVIAQYNLGSIYHQGISVPQDFGESYKWTRKAAEKGFPMAEFCLGEHYKFGDGVPLDYSEAFNWFLKSAKKGYPEAQYQVGLFFSTGKGVSRNPNLAAQWLRRAAAQGHRKSMEVLAEDQLKVTQRPNLFNNSPR